MLNATVINTYRMKPIMDWESLIENQLSWAQKLLDSVCALKCMDILTLIERIKIKDHLLLLVSDGLGKEAI